MPTFCCCAIATFSISRLQILHLIPRGIEIVRRHSIAMGWSCSSLLTMQFNAPHHNESHPPIDKNFCLGLSEVAPMAAHVNRVTPVEGTTNNTPSHPFTKQAPIEGITTSATNHRTNKHNASRKLSTYVLEDDMLSLDISDEDIASFMDGAMEQDDEFDNFDHQPNTPQGGGVGIDTEVQRQEAVLIKVMQKSAESRAAIQRLGILSPERLNDARKKLLGTESPSLSSATHLFVRNGTPQVACHNKDDAMSYDSIIAAARMALDH